MHIQNLFSDELPDIVGPPNPFAQKRKIQESTESSYDPSASLFSDGNETSFVFRIDQNPPKRTRTVDPTMTFSNSDEDIASRTYVIEPKNNQESQHLQQTLAFSIADKNPDLDETDSNSIWPSPPSLAEIELNPKQNANTEHLQTIDSSPGSPMDTSTPLDSDTEAAEPPVVVAGTSSKDTGPDLHQASTMLASDSNPRFL